MTQSDCLKGTDYQSMFNICHMCNIFNPVFWSYYMIKYQLSGHVTYCDDFVTLLLFESVTK